MFKALRRQRWTCPRCLHVQQRQQRGNATIASANHHDSPAAQPASFAQPGLQHDDRTIRQIFDDPNIGRAFSERAKRKTGKSAGLFLNRYLTDPAGFQRFASATLRKCHKLVAKILAAESLEELRNLAKDMDRLSDLLCRVIDLSDFVRATHSERSFQQAATLAYSMMYEYMNQLNTMTGLNDQLKRAMAIPEVVEAWTEEEKTVAQILIKDFSKSAIDLPEETRKQFVEISNDIAEAGNDFTENMAPETPILTLDKQKMKGMDPGMVKNLSRWGTLQLPTVGAPAYYALRQVEDADTRREIYMANRTASKSSIRRLEKLLKARSKLATLSGYDTFAHMALSDKMANSPEAVSKFLNALAADVRSRVQSELQDLLEMKNSDAQRGNFQGSISAWDKDYYSSRLLSGLHTRIRSPDSLSDYFSLGSVFQGLSRLFSSLYGIRFVPRESLPGETWHDDVRRLDVVDESGQHIAVVYCDLFTRTGKSPNPAHFTLRCSRAIAQYEIDEYTQDTSALATTPFDSPTEAATDGMAHATDPSSGTIFQLPTIALICDFSRPAASTSTASTKPTLLSFRDVQTLFHEMGHAVHSILGRTTLQNVAGTRCATDFAELPSVLMESFAFAPETLALWARHWKTDAPLPYGLVKERLEIDGRMQGAENEAQILLAMLDQAYHARTWGEGAAHQSSTQIYHDVYNRHGSVPEPAGTAWQGFFGHLYGYGATYYSYLFDRAIAARVWEVVFDKGRKSTDREAGEKFKNEVLKWGGSRDGWACVAGALGEDWMANGGPKAMEEVGKWGISEKSRG